MEYTDEKNFLPENETNYFESISKKIEKTADPDLKKYLSGVLKAAETTISDLKEIQDKLNLAQIDMNAANIAAQNARKEADDAELKSDIQLEALAAGAIDATDVLKFIPTKDVVLNKNGSSNIRELVVQLKSAKPHLFKKVSTSAQYFAPKPQNTPSKNALDMTLDEYRVAKAKFSKR